MRIRNEPAENTIANRRKLQEWPMPGGEIARSIALLLIALLAVAVPAAAGDPAPGGAGPGEAAGALSAEAAVRLALEQSPSVVAARSRLEAASAALRGARA